MPRPTKDLTNTVIGKWRVLHIDGDHKVASFTNRLLKNRNRTTWICRCECGNEASVLANNLLSGHSTSCGKCFSGKSPVSIEAKRRRAATDRALDALYSATNQRFIRGEKPDWWVTPRWREFGAFVDDMGFAPTDTATIVPIDTPAGTFTGTFEKGTCRWSTDSEAGND
jgi:hypothetical protein